MQDLGQLIVVVGLFWEFDSFFGADMLGGGESWRLRLEDTEEDREHWSSCILMVDAFVRY